MLVLFCPLLWLCVLTPWVWMSPKTLKVSFTYREDWLRWRENACSFWPLEPSIWWVDFMGQQQAASTRATHTTKRRTERRRRHDCMYSLSKSCICKVNCTEKPEQDRSRWIHGWAWCWAANLVLLVPTLTVAWQWT